MIVASSACGDDGASGGGGGQGGTPPLPDGVVARDVGDVEHIAVDAGKVYFQTSELEFFVVEAAGPRRIEGSLLGPGGFAVHGGVFYYAHDLATGRFDGNTNDTKWRELTLIAAEADDDFLYVANCVGVGRLPLTGDVTEGLIPGCFVTVGATRARIWAQNDDLALAVPKAGGEALDVAELVGLPPPKLVGTDETGAYFPSSDAFPLLRVDDDGTLLTLAGDGEHTSLVDNLPATSRYRVAARGASAYVLARRAPGEADGVVLRVPLDGSGAAAVASFRSAIATLAIDEAFVYYTDAGSIVRRPLD